MDKDLLKKVFPNEDLSNYGYKASDNLNMPPEVEYFTESELYAKKNRLIQLVDNMDISMDRKKEVIASINKVYDQYINEQKGRGKPNNKFKLYTHREEKPEMIDQSELDLLKEKYGFDTMSEDDREDFLDKYNNRFDSDNLEVDRVEGHTIM